MPFFLSRLSWQVIKTFCTHVSEAIWFIPEHVHGVLPGHLHHLHVAVQDAPGTPALKNSLDIYSVSLLSSWLMALSKVVILTVFKSALGSSSFNVGDTNNATSGCLVDICPMTVLGFSIYLASGGRPDDIYQMNVYLRYNWNRRLSIWHFPS